jgi:ribonuclease BN (tRNA processing enzyme)
MELTFLGTGSAFGPHAYNCSALVDQALLLDAGAPLHVHLPRVGVGIERIRGVLLSHFHLDHTIGLAFLVTGRAYLHPEGGAPLAIAGPPGVADHIRHLVEHGWGSEPLGQIDRGVPPSFQEVTDGGRFEIAGYRGIAHAVRHGRGPAFGYVVESGGVRLGYSGDATVGEGLHRLIQGSDHFVIEMTSDAAIPEHISRPEVEALMRQYPQVRFFITHRSSLGRVPGATMAEDFLTVKLPLPS